jgi:transposase-like protein
MILCPHCHTASLVKAGRNPSESQRYTCKTCQRVHTPEPTAKGYLPELHAQALRLYLEGTGIRRIGRLLGVNPQTVTNWINAAAAKVQPTPPQPAASDVIELDELYTFVA